MTGNSGAGIVLQPRDRKLFEELGLMRVIDREQSKVVVGFRSTTRANARLLALVRAGLLRRAFVGTIAGGRKAVYGLSAKGASLVGAPAATLETKPQGLLADLFFDHRQMVNSVYLAVKFEPIPSASFRRWLVFRTSLSPRIKLIPDGYFEIAAETGIYSMFLEADRGTEPLSRWKAKISDYLHLAVSGEFQRLFHQERFRVLVIAPSLRRLFMIRSVVAAATDKLFWFTDMESIRRSGFWSAIWTRPHDKENTKLFEPRSCATATTVTG